MIDAIDVFTLELPLFRPFRIARGQTEQLSTIVLRVQDGDTTGWGEAHPSPQVTRETSEQTRRLLTELSPADLSSKSPQDFLDTLPAKAPAARAALDLALLDLKGKQAQEPVHRLLGLPDGEVASTATLSLSTLGEAQRQAEHWIRRGYTRLKAKAGSQTDLLALLDAVQDALPDHVRPPMANPEVWIDGNEAFTADELLPLLPTLAEKGLALIEQPLPREDVDGLEQILDATNVPILLDEAITTPEDIARLRSFDGPLGVNLKTQKMGGLHRMKACLDLAQEVGVFAVIGCNIETGLGISAGAALSGTVDRVDLDGNLFLSQDPFPLPRPRPGFVATPEGPGLGVHPDPRFASALGLPGDPET